MKENVQTVGADVKTLQSEIAIKIDASALSVKSEVSDVRNDLREILIATSTAQAKMQASFHNVENSFQNVDKSFLNFEKLLALYVKAEVTQQLARGAGQSGH